MKGVGSTRPWSLYRGSFTLDIAFATTCKLSVMPGDTRGPTEVRYMIRKVVFTRSEMEV